MKQTLKNLLKFYKFFLNSCSSLRGSFLVVGPQPRLSAGDPANFAMVCIYVDVSGNCIDMLNHLKCL